MPKTKKTDTHNPHLSSEVEAQLRALSEADNVEQMLPEPDDLPAGHRSGFAAVIGRPNVGKSTLLNRLLQQKIAITSNKPQTTRDQIQGILTRDDSQIIFQDTPGIHKPKHKLGEYMMNDITATIAGADVVLWLVDVNSPPKDEDKRIAELLQEIHQKEPIEKLVLGLNKLDEWDRTRSKKGDERGDRGDAWISRVREYTLLLDWFALAKKVETDTNSSLSILEFSALSGNGVDALLQHVRDWLPLGPRYYPKEQVTDLQIRFMAEELIREKALLLLDQEVPHSIAVMIDEFARRNDDMTYISATVYVERDSQKSIVLGQKGAMIKKIGQSARSEIEQLVETKVYLELWVKVWEKWRKKPSLLRQLGYDERA